MGTSENNTLQGAPEISREYLEWVCAEKGVDIDQLLAATKALSTVVSSLCTTFVEAADNMKTSLEKLLAPIAYEFNPQKHWYEDLFWMVPARIRHLAYNHPKFRVRNKNWNRMWKIRERYMKNDKTESFPH